MRPDSAIASIVDLRVQRRWLCHRYVLPLFVLMSCGLIVFQQWSLWRDSTKIDPFYRNVLNLGVNYQRFLPSYHFFGAFPVNLAGKPAATEQEARASLQAIGPRLIPDRSVYNRASIFLFYPEVWLSGRPDTAEMRTGHALWFTFGLLAIFGAFCLAGLPLLGLLVALLCGSDPFQVWEVYRPGSSTIFATLISTGLVLAAATIWLSTRSAARHWRRSAVVVALCGVVAALQYEVRLEGLGIVVGAVIAGALCFRHQPVHRRQLALIFLAVAILTSSGLNAYFRTAFAKANALVASYGGTTTDSGTEYYSTQWWALWSGLGDFDEKYGFLADDRAGLSYYFGHGRPKPSEGVHRRNYLATIVTDPAWFAQVMSRRFDRVFLHNTPYRVTIGGFTRELPLPPLVITLLAVVGAVLGARAMGREALNGQLLNLVVLPICIGLVAVAQLADYGLQFYCIPHLFVLAYVGCLATECVLTIAAGPQVPVVS